GTTCNLTVAGSNPVGVTTVAQLVRASETFLRSLSLPFLLICELYMSTNPSRQFIPDGEATAILPTGGKHTPISVIGTEAIRDTFDEMCLQQAINSRTAPGVTDLVLNPDAHCGYGAPVGCVMVSPTHIYPGPVGVDIKCSMSLLQTNIPADTINDRSLRRELIDAILRRIPTGAGRGQRNAPRSRKVTTDLGRLA